MISQETLEKLPQILTDRINKANTELLTRMGKQIRKIGTLGAANVHKLEQMRLMGASLRRIKKALADASGKNLKEIEVIFERLAKDAYFDAEPYYRWRELDFIPYEENKKLQTLVKSIAKQAQKDYMNLSHTTAVSLKDKRGNTVALPLEKAYKTVIDQAIHNVLTGKESYQSEFRRTLRDFASSGLKAVEYESGYVRRLDSAVRMNLLEGMKQINQALQDYVGAEVGADGVEISVHEAPAPDHADIQGQQMSNEEFERWQKEHQYPRRQIGKLNCYHFAFRVVLGVNKPNYTQEQLNDIKRRNTEGITFEGKHYTLYEARQMQRKLEVAIRKEKDLQTLARAAGDETLVRETRMKQNRLVNRYKALSDAAGLSYKHDRLNAGMLTRTRKSSIINVLPNADKVVIDINKFTGYALNPSKDLNKATAFRSALGYTSDNAEELIQNIRGNISKFNAVEKPNNGYGTRYEVIMTLMGPNGKRANVKTGWIKDKETGETRLTSAYVTKKKFGANENET